MATIWILGATGRTGRAVAERLAGRHDLVLAGRSADRLRAAADRLGARTAIVPTLDEVRGQLAKAAPAVVVNLVGPFTDSGPATARACPPGTHYVDVANELHAVTGILDANDEAVAAGSTWVTGAGFGVLATESVVLRLCAGRPVPDRVRVDAIASVDGEAGAVGTALAGSVLDALAAGGRRYRDGRLVRDRLAGDPERLVLPDGTPITTLGGPSGELIAAQRASGAPDVIAASALLPSSRAFRAVLPAVATLMSISPVRRTATRSLARVQVKAVERPREHSWARARVEDPAGTRTGWLRAPEGMAFTSAVTAEVADRLARGDGKPGTFTPGALFGPELAEAAGGTFLH